jgi:carbon monoxide dehydrogenase subunit G
LQLVNEITVAADVDLTWTTLLDIERVARCLPGATLDGGAETGLLRGVMMVRIGPMMVAYEGTARLGEIDEDDRTAAIEVRGREIKGQGTAAATITSRLVDDGDATIVKVETDLVTTGPPAQFGRGIMQEIVATTLTGFATRLEQQIVAAPPVTHASLRRRALPAIGALVLLALLLRLRRR